MNDHATNMEPLRCDRRTHARVTDDGAIEIHCRYCSQRIGHPVYHWWRYDVLARRWERLTEKAMATAA